MNTSVSAVFFYHRLELQTGNHKLPSLIIPLDPVAGTLLCLDRTSFSCIHTYRLNLDTILQFMTIHCYWLLLDRAMLHYTIYY